VRRDGKVVRINIPHPETGQVSLGQMERSPVGRMNAAYRSVSSASLSASAIIGLPTAATLASRGVEVIGVDINPQVVDAVNAGQPYFSEPDLDKLLRAATTLGKLRATPRPEPADAFVIAVSTAEASPVAISPC
jgi:hypothetical protein